MVQIVEHQGKGQTFGYDSDGNRLFRTVSRNNGNGNGNGSPNHGIGNGKGQGYDNGEGHDKQEDKELNKPEAYEYIRYLNDISVAYPQVLMTADSKGTYRGVYTYGLERISVRDQVSVEGKPNNPLYYLYDGRGSVSQLTNTIGNVRDQYRYEPFGAPMPGGGLEPDTRLLNNPYGYNAEDYDIESNLQYLRARYYNPEIGRFISEDSYLGEIMQPLSLNRYAYTANNPLMYQDPSGHSFIGAMWNGAAQLGNEMWNGAKQVGNEMWNGAKQVGNEMWNGAKQVGNEMWNGAKQVGNEMWNGAKQLGNNYVVKPFNNHVVQPTVKGVNQFYQRITSPSKRGNSSYKKKARSRYKNYAAQIASQVKSYNKAFCETTAKIGKSIYKNGNLILDGVQFGLDVAGLVPGFGEIADGANTLISLAIGDKVGAMMSAAAMAPLAAWKRNGRSYTDSKKEVIIYDPKKYEDKAERLREELYSTNNPIKKTWVYTKAASLIWEQRIDKATISAKIMNYQFYGLDPEYTELGFKIPLGEALFGSMFGTLKGVKYAKKGPGKTGADNIATGPKLNAQLTYEEASSVFTKSRTLQPEVVKNSSAIIPGNQLKNPDVINALTKNGGNINDWSKMTTPTFKSPSGDFQVHFYQNLKTGEVSTFEMKVKFNK